jgi:hypothetical protein
MITFEGPARFSQLFGGIAVGPEDGPRPEHIRHGDRRGHEAGDAERGALEARYEELLEAAEKQSRESMVALRGFEPRFDG